MLFIHHPVSLISKALGPVCSLCEERVTLIPLGGAITSLTAFMPQQLHRPDAHMIPLLPGAEKDARLAVF